MTSQVILVSQQSGAIDSDQYYSKKPWLEDVVK